MLVFVTIFVGKFGRYSIRNVVAGYRWILCSGYGSCLFNNVSFLSYFLPLTPSVIGYRRMRQRYMLHWSVNLVVMSVFILMDILYIHHSYTNDKGGS